MKKQITATVLAAVLAAGMPGTALAAVGPSGVDTTQSGVSNGSPAGTSEDMAVKAAALQDNKMEYWELGDLIENYNITYKNAKSQLVNATPDLDTARALREEASELQIEANELRSSGLDETTKEVYESYKETAKELRKQAQKISNAELGASYQKTLRKAKAQLTFMAQQTMIGYQQAAANQELTDKSLELAKAVLDSAKRQASQGMKSQEELLDAEQTYKLAESGALQFQAQLQSVKQNLQMVTGWSHDAEPEICPIPEPDLARISGMNPQNDLQNAIGANFELSDTRSASAAGSSARGVKQRNISQSEQGLASTLESLYSDVIAKQQAYEGAQADFEAATQIMRAADSRNKLGMMGRLEYLNAQVSYLTAKAARETAALQLTSAMDTYDWAVSGLVISGKGGM